MNNNEDQFDKIMKIMRSMNVRQLKTQIAIALLSNGIFIHPDFRKELTEYLTQIYNELEE